MPKSGSFCSSTRQESRFDVPWAAYRGFRRSPVDHQQKFVTRSVVVATNLDDLAAYPLVASVHDGAPFVRSYCVASIFMALRSPRLFVPARLQRPMGTHRAPSRPDPLLCETVA